MTDKEQSKVLDAQSMLTYQESSIVSRVLLKKKSGNVTLFAFDKDQELSEHTAPFDAIVQVIDGEAEVTIDGKKETVAAGQMIIMPANIPHALYAKKKFKMILTMIKQI